MSAHIIEEDDQYEPDFEEAPSSNVPDVRTSALYRKSHEVVVRHSKKISSQFNNDEVEETESLRAR
jgi:hypothetical protein